MAIERGRLRGLYAVTPELAETDVLAARVAASLRGGARLVQYRAKALPGPLALAQASRLAALCREHGVPFIVNDSVPLALAAGADGVHLGREDGDPAAARRAFPGGILGISCYDDVARARRAADAGADYVAVGSMYASGTKPGAVRAPLSLLAAAREASGGLPVCAIGGIDAGNAPALVAAGADLLAVISAVFEAPDVERAARDIARLFDPTAGASDARAQPRAV